MTYLAYVMYMSIGTIMALGVWVWTLLSINPETSGPAGILLFYVSLGLSLVGVFALLGLIIRVVIIRTSMMRIFVVRSSFRQSILFTLLVMSSLVLQMYSMMTWWAFLLLFMFAISLEFFFASGDHL